MTNVEKAILTVCLTAFLLLILIVIRAPSFPQEQKILPNIHLLDERHFQSLTTKYLQEGFSVKYFRELTGMAPGPLYQLTQVSFYPITKLKIPYVRIVNIILFLAIIAVLSKVLKINNTPLPFSSSLQLLAIPSMYSIIGLAITEIPAMFFFCCHILFLFETASIFNKKPYGFKIYFYIFLSGILLSCSILGRQTYLVTIIASLYFLYRLGFSKTMIALYTIAALFIPSILFIVMGGLVVPQQVYITKGFSLLNTIFSLSFGAVFYSIYSCSWVKKYRKALIYSIIICVILNNLTGLTGRVIFKTIVARLLPPSLVEIYALSLNGVIIGFGLIFLFHLISLLRSYKKINELYLYLAIIFFLLTPGKITGWFTPRYTIGIAPLILMIAINEGKNTYWKLLRIGVGCFLGLVYLSIVLGYVKTIY